MEVLVFEIHLRQFCARSSWQQTSRRLFKQVVRRRESLERVTTNDKLFFNTVLSLVTSQIEHPCPKIPGISNFAHHLLSHYYSGMLAHYVIMLANINKKKFNEKSKIHEKVLKYKKKVINKKKSPKLMEKKSEKVEKFQKLKIVSDLNRRTFK